MEGNNFIAIIFFVKLIFFFREMCENEMGINLRQSIALIAEVLSFNSKLRDGLNEMVTVDSEWVLKFSGRYLEMLIECITFIGKLVGVFAFLHFND